MTLSLFLFTALWLALFVVAGPVSGPQSSELALVALSTRDEVVTAVPMLASFFPLVSYGTIAFVIAYIAAKFKSLFRLRRRGPHYLDDEDEASVELLPTSTADVRPELRDFAVLPPVVLSPPPRLGRPMELALDRLKSGRSHGRSHSLSLPSSSSQATLRPRTPEHSLSPRFHSTPNTPSPLIDLSIPEGIHPRKPFVNEWASDANVSSDTLFGVGRTLSNRSEDIADIYLKMKGSVAESAPPSPVESHASEQDITLVQTDVDLIDFSPKQRALMLESSILNGGIGPVDSHKAKVLIDLEDRRVPEPIVELLDLSQWDQSDWGFDIVSPSVAPEPPSPIQDEHDEARSEGVDKGIEDPFASPRMATSVLETAVEEPSDVHGVNPFASPSIAIAALADDVNYVLDQNPFASPMLDTLSLGQEGIDSTSLDEPSSSDFVANVDAIGMPKDEVSSLDASEDRSPSSSQASSVLEVTQPVYAHLNSSSSLLLSAEELPSGDNDNSAISDDSLDSMTNSPLLPHTDSGNELPESPVVSGTELPLSVDTTVVACKAQPESATVPEHSALPSPAEDLISLPPLNDLLNERYDDNDSHETLDNLMSTVSIPDPDFLPLVSPQMDVQTPTPPDSPLLVPAKKAKPAWSIRAADAPALGLSASASSVDVSSPVESNKEKKEPVALALSAALESTPVPSPSPSPPMLSTALPGSFPAAEPTPAPVVESKAVEKAAQRPRVTRSPIDIALAMQLRPGLGIGADPAWMVRFLMSMFGWMVVLISGTGGSEGYHYPVRR